jgi:hypothetical protein
VLASCRQTRSGSRRRATAQCLFPSCPPSTISGTLAKS